MVSYSPTLLPFCPAIHLFALYGLLRGGMAFPRVSLTFYPAHPFFGPLYGPPMFLTAVWPTHVSDRFMARPCQFLTALWTDHVSFLPLYGPPMSVSDRSMAHPCQFLTALWPTHVSF